MKKNVILLFFTVAYLVSGCADLKHVNSFSNTSVKTLKSYDDIGYTFTSSYYNYSLQKNIYNLSGDLDKNVLSLPTPVIIANEPDNAQKSDKVITFYITSIASYFEGIAKLSDKDLVNYNFDDISNNLTADNSLKNSLNITNNEITAASKIAKVFSDEIMGAYREKKIRQIIIKYDSDVSLSIDALVKMIGVVSSSVDNRKTLVDTKYLLALQNPKIDVTRKLDLSKSYQDEQKQLDIYKYQLGEYINALKKIKEEHNKTSVLLNNKKLSAKEVKDLINQYGAEVYQLYNNIKNLLSKN